MRIPGQRAPLRETIVPDPESSFTARAFRVGFWPFSWHDHPEMELTLIEAGSGLRYVGDSVEAFAPGDCCLLGAFLPHTWTSTAQPGQESVSVVAQFPPLVAGEGLALAEAVTLRAVAARAAGGLHLTGSLGRDVAAGLRRLPDQRGIARLGGLWTLLIRIAEGDEDEVRVLSRPAASGESDPRLARVLELVDERATTGITQAEAAASLGLTAPSFSRWFRHRLGRTFVAHLNAVRIGIARRLLVDGDAPITTVALAAGFDSLANFNRRFRALAGETPTTFRARARG